MHELKTLTLEPNQEVAVEGLLNVMHVEYIADLRRFGVVCWCGPSGVSGIVKVLVGAQPFVTPAGWHAYWNANRHAGIVHSGGNSLAWMLVIYCKNLVAAAADKPAPAEADKPSEDPAATAKKLFATRKATNG